MLGEVPPGDRRERVGTARAELEVAAQPEDRVAQPLGIEPPAVEMRQPDVLRVRLEGLLLGPGDRPVGPPAGHPVGPREHDPAVQALDRPAVLDEPAGQPVEQLGVRGGGAAGAEVARRGHQAAAEMVLPDAVDQHPGRQRVLRVGQGGGQLAAARSLRDGGPVAAPEHGQEPPRDLRAQVRRIARALDLRVGRLGGLGHGVREGRGTPRLAHRHEIAGPLHLFRAGERVPAAGQDAVEGVIVRTVDRVELVVVAAGAGDASGRARSCPGCRSCPRWSGDGSSGVEAEPSGQGQEPGGDDPRREAVGRALGASTSPAICSVRKSL